MVFEMCVTAATIAFCLVFVPVVSSLNLRPIIGILAQEANFGNGYLPGEAYVSPEYLRKMESLGDTYIPANYVKWLESAGARVVPIRIKEPMEYYEKIFHSINGVLFPGGGVDILKSEYAKAAKILYKMALEPELIRDGSIWGPRGPKWDPPLTNFFFRCAAQKEKLSNSEYNKMYVGRANDKGDFFPLWGTCLGFELLTALTSGEDLLASADAENLPLPLDFSKGFRHSRLFGHLPEDVYQTLATQNVTPNFHHFTLTPQNFSKNANLKKFYQVLSTNRDRNGMEFLSSLEAFKYPVYAIQWHPEKNNYAWNPKYNVDHTASGIRVSQYFADFVVSEARKSSHHFPDLEQEIQAMINNYHPLFSHDTLFLENYFFNYTKV